MNDDLDTLLQAACLQPPPDFTQRVMQALPQRTSPPPQPVRTVRNPWQRLRWLAAASSLVGTGLLGLSQLASFVFGLWIASAAL